MRLGDERAFGSIEQVSLRGLDQRRSKLEVGEISASRRVVTDQGSVGGDGSSNGDYEGGCWVERSKR